MTGHHRPLTGVVDEHGDRAGEVGVRLDEVRIDVLAIQVLLCELAHPVAPDLADEGSIEAAALRPHRDVRGAAAGRQHHLAERVAAAQQL